MNTHLTRLAFVNRLSIVLFAAYALLAPAALLLRDLRDPALRGPGIPACAWRTHRAISPDFARWARTRVARGAGARFGVKEDVPATEWPLFSCVFYLMATDNLQAEWARTRPTPATAPAVYAREAIEAAAALLTDPAHHAWVRDYWGTNIWSHHNLFFRSLIIAGLTRYESLTGDRRHHDLLTNQVITLAGELDRSPHGLLEDYPGECYPIDVLAAVGWIRASDRVTGLDYAAFAARAERAFTGPGLDRRGLVPYMVEIRSRYQDMSARGTGNSWVGVFAPRLWPATARRWHDAYTAQFWQERWLAAGFREYPRDMPEYDWGFDIDSGPLIAGFSPAANAFGVAAARVNGRFDQAFMLGAQMLAASWPLPHGALLGARRLSDAAAAPYLGEAAIVYFLTEQPAPGMPLRAGGGRWPGFVVAWFGLYLGLGLLFWVAAERRWRLWHRLLAAGYSVAWPRVQAALWWTAMLAAASMTALAWSGGAPGPAVLALLLAQFFPRLPRLRVPDRGPDEAVNGGLPPPHDA